MTPAHTDSPLRRSDVNLYRESAGGPNVTINDDDEERRQARRRTLLQSTGTDSSTGGGTFEDNETLKKCLEIYNGNKLSRENAWSMSLIDTLSTLLDRHHKSLNNFKVAGSSLEASSKVYGLRVDSIHIDVLRMSAGLNAQKFNEKAVNGDDDDDDVAAVGGGGGDDANKNTGQDGADPNASPQKQQAPKKPKRQRKAVSTITKNKETLNARLDTVPLQDPVFGKLNSIVGSINSSNRLMNNILLTTDSELRLRTNFQFWDSSELPKEDYTAAVRLEESEWESAPCDRLFKVENYDELKLRPTHGGYVISDTPEAIPEEADRRRMSLNSNASGAGDGFHDNLQNQSEMSMAFDLNAECEPLPVLGIENAAPLLDVDFGDFDELTNDERTLVNNCRGLRKQPVLIEDLRPVDASSKLEYSYRPLDKISQFWAGPSHWKFKRGKARPSTMNTQQVLSGTDQRQNGRMLNQRGKRAAHLAKQRTKQLNFGEFHDDLFVKLDEKYKARKTNITKKWDQRKLKLPTDLQIDPLMFYKYTYAPGLPILQTDMEEQLAPASLPDSANLENDSMLNHNPMDDNEHHFGDDDDVGLGANNFMNVSSVSATATTNNEHIGGTQGELVAAETEGFDGCNNTVLEIATDFEGAPSQVTKIIVPFAKRAKVIDMKNLKRCCSQLLLRQMKQTAHEIQTPVHPTAKQESYAQGMAHFKEIYDHLPELLTKSMSDSLTPSVAFYSVLHLANDFNLRLIPQEDLEDFAIRQVIT